MAPKPENVEEVEDHDDLVGEHSRKVNPIVYYLIQSSLTIFVSTMLFIRLLFSTIIHPMRRKDITNVTTIDLKQKKTVSFEDKIEDIVVLNTETVPTSA